MPIKIYNSLTRTKDEFEPIKKGHVGIYVCGPTVYDEPHIGHVRSACIFDVIRRYLEHKKLKVTFVRNVTDVDDKIINKAREEFSGEDLNEATKKVSSKYLEAYYEAMDALGIKRPDTEPKATEYIGKMIRFIEGLIKREVAYVSGQDVYFDIKKAKDYGKLSNQSVKNMESGARICSGENKKDPLDFALWKSSKENEPYWESPWGKGRPGWHIECSTMSSDTLGDEFDIHGGGIDLIFPHHENEIAQSEGAGKKFANYWIHHGLLTINGQKMAKSLGNFITVKDFIDKGYSPDVLKLLFLQTHYSQPVDFTWDIIDQKRNSLDTIQIFLKKVKEKAEGSGFNSGKDSKKLIPAKELREKIADFCNDFEKSMDDDFNTPNATAVLFEIIRACNKVLYDVKITKEHIQVLKYACEKIRLLAEVLRLRLEEEKVDLDLKRYIESKKRFQKSR